MDYFVNCHPVLIGSPAASNQLRQAQLFAYEVDLPLTGSRTEHVRVVNEGREKFVIGVWGHVRHCSDISRRKIWRLPGAMPV